MKYLLSILCLFVLSCDSGGSDEAIECASGIVDECGICDGDGIVEPYCDCSGNVYDCDEVCGGDNLVVEPYCSCDDDIYDECGECGGDNSSCYVELILGEWLFITESIYDEYDNLIYSSSIDDELIFKFLEGNIYERWLDGYLEIEYQNMTYLLSSNILTIGDKLGTADEAIADEYIIITIESNNLLLKIEHYDEYECQNFGVCEYGYYIFSFNRINE